MYRKDINCLRGFAIIIIILYHYLPNIFFGGFIGVDILFSISGYLIYYSLCKKKNYTILSFYANRLKRLCPSKIIVMVGIIIFYWNINLIDLEELLNQCKNSIIFNLNNYYQLKNIDYLSKFQKKFNSPILHFWTLSIEFQFYIVAPFISLLHNRITILYTLFFPLGLLYSNFYTNVNYTNSYFSFFIRLLDFYAGIVGVIKQIESNKYVNLLSFFSILLFSLSKYFIKYYPGFVILLPMLFSLTFLSSSKYNVYIYSFTLNSIGTISYSLYLIHYPFVFMQNIMLKFLFSFILGYIFFIVIESNTKYIILNTKLIILSYIFFVYIFTVLINSIVKKKYKLFNKIKYNNVWIYNNRFISNCIITNYKSNNILLKSYILLLGDSHMQHFFPAINYYLQKNNSTAIGIYFWGNRIINNDYLILKKVFKIIDSPPILILISFLLSNFPIISNISLFNNNFPNFIFMLKEYSKNIILFDETPVHSYNPYKLFYSSKQSYCLINVNCTVSEYNITSNMNITYISVRKMFCRNNICPDVIDNILVYNDNNHITLEFSLTLKHYFYKILKKYTSQVKSFYLYSECVISEQKMFNTFKRNI